jgi:hypothetical protein
MVEKALWHILLETTVHVLPSSVSMVNLDMLNGNIEVGLELGKGRTRVQLAPCKSYRTLWGGGTNWPAQDKQSGSSILLLISYNSRSIIPIMMTERS